TGRIFPGDGRPGLDLRPRNLGTVPAAIATLGDEIIDAALAFLVAGIPVLHSGIFELGVVERDELDHGSVKLVLVAHRRGAAFEITDIGALVAEVRGPLDRTAVVCIDAEIG